ncbi:endonuclease/exonuclease/phosphatase family protein [Wenxinia marina]|uniref:endonuclease/exonuclease/phosphatase family protein n=1 Tax=Wenxinia marina TaxID=390641 RepID=UPI0020C7511D|nr:endonuclease/exonuclease/phosphatase family protein [Wenxinia marina]
MRPDLLLLTDIDFDAGHAAITALQGALAERGVDLPHAFALPPNSGVPTGRDLDGNGRLGEARDAQGYGRFAGDGGLALLSRWPFATGARDFTSLLWADLPGATLPGGEANADIQRLSSTAHWQVPLTLPDGPATILAWSATPPVFDGPEDRNGLRGADEARLWTVLMDGGLGPPPEGRLIVMGNANLDPADGDGRREAIAAAKTASPPDPTASPGSTSPWTEEDRPRHAVRPRDDLGEVSSTPDPISVRLSAPAASPRRGTLAAADDPLVKARSPGAPPALDPARPRVYAASDP